MIKNIRRLLRKPRPLALLTVLVIALIALGAYTVLQHPAKQIAANTTPRATDRNINYSPASKADNSSNETRKGSPSSSTTLDNYQAPPNTGSFTVTITRASIDNANQTLEVATIINGVNSGSCTINVHRAGQQTITQPESIAFQVNSYVCPVFSIPLSEFPVKGNWNVSMTVESGGKTVSSDWAQNPVSLG